MKQTYGSRPMTDRPRQSNRVEVDIEVNGASESRLVFCWVSWFKTV
jgi:exonuclease I